MNPEDDFSGDRSSIELVLGWNRLMRMILVLYASHGDNSGGGGSGGGGGGGGSGRGWQRRGGVASLVAAAVAAMKRLRTMVARTDAIAQTSGLNVDLPN